MTRALIVCAVSTPEQAKDDKESLDRQEKDALAKCEDEGWDVIDIVRIPGYSRSFYTLRDLVEAAEKDREYGPSKLEAHIKNCDFDVMIVRSTNRFNREQSLNAEIIGRVVKECGAIIFSFMDGTIDINNRRAMAAITGYRDSSEVDEFVRKRAIGMVGRAKKGLPSNGKLPLSHKRVYNPVNGKEEGIALRDELLPMWDDLAKLLLENVAYHRLEEVMYERWGYTDDNGVPHKRGKFRFTLLNPMFWGNSVIRRMSHKVNYQPGIWAFDPSVSPPSGIEIFFNTHEPTYKGELAEKVKAEVRRRTEIVNASSNRWGTGAFSNLFICRTCWGTCSYSRKSDNGITFIYLICTTYRSQAYRPGRTCTNHKQLTEKKAKSWMNQRLSQWIESGEVTFDFPDRRSDEELELKRIQATVTKHQHKLDRLIQESTEVDEDLRQHYRKQIRTVKDELNRAEEKMREIQHRLHREEEATRSQQLVIKQIKEIGLTRFWEQPPLKINQMLKSLLGTVRLVMDAGEVVGFVDKRDLK